MPDKFNRPADPARALYHDVLCGDIGKVQLAIRETPELVKRQSVIGGAWSHGGRRCGAQDDVIVCLFLLAENGADFTNLGADQFDTAFKAFPRAAELLLELGADASKPDGNGTTGLHYMAAIGFRHACDVLLKHGADINAKTNDGETPLDIAIKQNLPRMIGHLRALGAQTDDAVGDDSQPAEKQAEQTRDGFRIGSVTWYRGDRGYGYLRDGEAKESSVYGELFFDRESVFGREPDSVEEGTPLSFQVIHDKFGLRAANVEFA